MKKALAIISAVALVSAVAFAEDGVKISGQIETGIQAMTGDGADYVKLYETDAPGATRIDLDVTATQGNTGLWYKFRSADGTTAPSVANFKVYANLADNLVTITAGNPDDNAWKTDAAEDYTYENGYGVRFDVHPVAGLTVGAKINTAAPSATQYDWKQTANEMSFGGKYATDLFIVSGSYKLDSDADDTGVNAKKYSEAAVGFNYLGIANLLAQSEVKITGAGKFADIGYALFDEKFEYKVNDPTLLGLKIYEGVYGKDYLNAAGEKAKTFLKFVPYVNYKLSAITLVKAEFGYSINQAGIKDYNNVYFTPGAEFQVTPNSQIRTDYTYAIDDTGDKAYGKATTHTLNLGFRYSF